TGSPYTFILESTLAGSVLQRCYFDKQLYNNITSIAPTSVVTPTTSYTPVATLAVPTTSAYKLPQFGMWVREFSDHTVRITEVEGGGGSDRAGIKNGEIITAVNGIGATLNRVLTTYTSGRRFTLTFNDGRVQGFSGNYTTTTVIYEFSY